MTEITLKVALTGDTEYDAEVDELGELALHVAREQGDTDADD